MLKTFKYRIYPNKEQKEKIEKHFGACRFIYNWALQRKKETLEKEGKFLSRFDLIKEMVEMKKEVIWLKEIHSQVLQLSIYKLESDYIRYKMKFPKFKTKKNSKQTYQYSQHIFIDNDKVFLPKIGRVKLIQDRKFEGKIKTSIVSKTSTIKYVVSILVDDGLPVPEKQKYSKITTEGVDVGLKHFATLSSGEKIEHPKFLIKAEKKLKRLQRRLSKKKKGSSNRNKARVRLAIQHEKVKNCRKDFLHKLSTMLLSENQAIAIETLDVEKMLKTKFLAKRISDSGWSEFFRQLKYKAEWRGKTILEIGQYEPSSKTCNVCGTIKETLQLKDRVWICSSCSTKHDRDINAAINIKNIALNIPMGSRESTLGEIAECCGR